MEPDNLPGTSYPTETSGAGDLVVQNGRQAGARRPLGTPTTLVGRGQGCDIRLNVDGVDPLHCLLVQSADGVQLRDLNSVQGTFINGALVENVVLRHGDLLNVGPFQFRVELPAPPAARLPQLDEMTEDDYRESLRIQAAAVAAQQAALEEEELRLQQRRNDLQQQEEQLAAHLAEKQRQVQLWSEYTRTERETFRQEKIEHEKRRAELEKDLLDAKEEAQKRQQHLALERQRIDNVYQRLRERWKRQWSAEKEKYQNLAKKLDADSQVLKNQHALLRMQESSLEEEIVRCNTERELSKRQLHEARDLLTKDQAHWRRRRSLEMLALKAKAREADGAHKKLTQARDLLLQDKNAWDRQLVSLRQELLGLNNRIVHQRNSAEQQRQEISRLEAILRERGRQIEETPTAEPTPGESITEPAPIECEVQVVAPMAEPVHAFAPVENDDWNRRFEGLNRLAGELADQRVHLVEQYVRLAEIQDAWQGERDRAAAELENLAQRLVAEEQRLADRHERADQTDQALRERQQQIDTMRGEMLVTRTQWQARAQAFAQEHQRQIDALNQKEALLQNQLVGLADLRQRWNRRRQQEMDELRASRTALALQQKETQEQRVTLFGKSQRIEEEQRLLTEKTLALEQYRQEVIFRAKDPAAQRRIERLRRRWVALNAELIRDAKNERETTKQEFTRLDALRADVLEMVTRLAKNDVTLNEKQALLEEREAHLEARRTQVQVELANLDSQRQMVAQKHLSMLDEVDSFAKAIYDEPDTATEKAA